jgi:hypothetical protein
MRYQEQLDKIFGNGSLWNHRTLRTVFDPYSSEYEQTTMDRKVEILRTIVDNNISLAELISEYKDFYKEEKKTNVVEAMEDGLTNLLTKALAK